MKDNSKKNGTIIKWIIGLVIVILVVLLFWFVFYQDKDLKWIQNGDQISKGELVYEVGDYFEYDETNKGKITGLTDVKWKVLGVDDDGHLLIMADSNVDEISLGSDDDLEISKQDYIDGNQKLDDISRKYAKGENAISGRSITADDINMITKIDSTYIDTWKNTFTYYWTNEENPVSKNHNSGDFFTTKLAYHGSYLWFDEKTNQWNSSQKNGSETSENPTEIVTLDNSHSPYNFSVWSDEKNDYVDVMEKDSKAYQMIFSSDPMAKHNYWTATKFISATQSYSAYGYYVVKTNDLNYAYLVYSSGNIRKSTHGVRAVVTIK